MDCALDSGSSGPGSSPGCEQCDVLLGKTTEYSHSVVNLMLVVALQWTSIPSKGK